MSVDKSEARVRRMFGEIAGRYDLLNHLLSLNVDRYWRWRTVRAGAAAGRRADPRPVHRHGRPGPGLLSAARRGRRRSSAPISATRCWPWATESAQRAGINGRVAFVEADAQRLPFPDDHFQIVSRRLRPAQRDRHRPRPGGDGPRLPARRAGGDAGVLDAALAAVSGRLRLVLSPRAAADRPVAGPQPAQRLRVPAAERGRISRRAKHWRSEMRAAGLCDVRWQPLTLGIATLYVGAASRRSPTSAECGVRNAE